MPTDETIADLYVRARIDQVEQDRVQRGAPIRWGTAIEWEDLHHKTWKR